MARTSTRTARRLAAGAAALVATGALLSGCALGTAGGYVPTGDLTGDLADFDGALDGAEITVGSKNFNENVILGKMAIILLRSAGAEVTDLTNIPGSAAARQAQTDGQIDAMWEYTGTGWITYLGEAEPIPDEQEQYEAVRDADLEQNQLVWLPPAPMNNTYAFAMNPEVTQRLGIESMSQIADLPVEERTFCVESEFTNRPDGLPGMLETYGIPLDQPDGTPESNLRTYQTGAIYDATARGECNFGEVFTTDGRILALDLTVLEDDQEYFPKYNVSLVLREETAEEHPEIKELMAPVTEELTDEVLLELNARVDVEGEEPAEVAYQWLEEQGFVESP
ncbi:glycine betaine ABC transporter substrate-binding protein [Nocardioides zeae]|uniref:Glycine betaine ABC transporter substrate-binding protein n=1 Tax=Nocardioides zeae TaxID=1457234 RepID=A0A6P0HEA2_9ACTN|nr:glycine betaine ABC transporter substrate-binding protein [Nocardioides zeae]